MNDSNHRGLHSELLPTRRLFSIASIVLVTVAIALAFTYVFMRPDRDLDAQGTITTDNLTATTNIQLNSATASTLTEYNGSKQLISYAGSGCGVGSAIQSISAAGGATCIAAGGGGSPAVAAAHTTYAAGVNLSTLGTIDWVKCSVNTGISALDAFGSTVHYKLNGGWLFRTVVPLGNYSSTTATDLTFTSTAADDSKLVAMSDAGYCDLFSTSAQLFGFYMKVPADTAQRKLRMYYILREDDPSHCTVTTTATLSISGTTANDNINVVGVSNQVVTITFTGGVTNDELLVNTINVTPSGSSCVIALVAASLGPT